MVAIFLRGGLNMYGHTRLVERKIRMWIVRQEANRRKEGQAARINARGDALGKPGQAGRRLKV
jgi:hypothetical protein